MNSFLPIFLAVLGVAMFSVSIWVQRDWLPAVEEGRLLERTTALETAREGGQPSEEEALSLESEPKDGWATNHVILK